jgi:hypothetical protein
MVLLRKALVSPVLRRMTHTHQAKHLGHSWTGFCQSGCHVLRRQEAAPHTKRQRRVLQKIAYTLNLGHFEDFDINRGCRASVASKVATKASLPQGGIPCGSDPQIAISRSRMPSHTQWHRGHKNSGCKRAIHDLCIACSRMQRGTALSLMPMPQIPLFFQRGGVQGLGLCITTSALRGNAASTAPRYVTQSVTGSIPTQSVGTMKLSENDDAAYLCPTTATAVRTRITKRAFRPARLSHIATTDSNYTFCHPPPSALYKSTIALICFCFVSMSSFLASRASLCVNKTSR